MEYNPYAAPQTPPEYCPVDDFEFIVYPVFLIVIILCTPIVWPLYLMAYVNVLIGIKYTKLSEAFLSTCTFLIYLPIQWGWALLLSKGLSYVNQLFA
jgi:hypothetical protein